MFTPRSALESERTQSAEVTLTETSVPTATTTKSASVTETTMPTITATSTEVLTDTAEPTVAMTETLIPTETVTETSVPTATTTVSATVTETSVLTVTATASEIPTDTAEPTVAMTETLIPTETATETSVPTATMTASATVTETSVPTVAVTATATQQAAVIQIQSTILSVTQVAPKSTEIPPYASPETSSALPEIIITPLVPTASPKTFSEMLYFSELNNEAQVQISLEAGSSRHYTFLTNGDNYLILSAEKAPNDTILVLRNSYGTELFSAQGKISSEMVYLQEGGWYSIQVTSLREPSDYQLNLIMPEKLAFFRNQTSIGVVQELDAGSVRRFTISKSADKLLKLTLTSAENGEIALSILGIGSDQQHVFETNEPISWSSDTIAETYLIEIRSADQPTQIELALEIVQALP